MKVIVRTQVRCPLEQVWQRFDQELFEALAPPFPPVRLLRYDGNQEGDQVHLSLDLGVVQFAWVSLITEVRRSETESYFVDEGLALPPLLTYWRHRHRLLRLSAHHTLIIDEVEYRMASRAVEIAAAPGFWAQFLYRQPIYRRYFDTASA
ncbi:Ligand-binding SRPBCC domain-containing protein [Catalinimonas alkaloidigena]|uniref:Ligand-binding SRPBCC domain-containing protein n=1 Tax=Catalinimonas alkaloidigena TaxID=1075417 RepID=A0A1G9EXQ3_9BACT|nr:hypothetical protein [Catalinimonas alkaloidigena]SDK80934.1 Ligand-binding SRPBCC domain-containing protein [Catalinimonas alkaloidigena]